MKQLINIAAVLVLCIMLCGCPYSSPYTIDDKAGQNIDESLLGKWAAFVTKPSDDRHTLEDPVKVIFEKRTDNEYDVAITGYLNELRPYKVLVNDTIKGTAFISTIGSHQFLNATFYSKVYIAELKHDDKQLSILALSEHFTAKYIKNNTALRNAIDFHYRTRPVPTYDDWFVIRDLKKVN